MYRSICLSLIHISEPTYVEKCGDEVWLAVKFQSNSDIAGSPRNRFRPVSYTHLDVYKRQVPISVETNGELVTGKAIASILINNNTSYSITIYGDQAHLIQAQLLYQATAS